MYYILKLMTHPWVLSLLFLAPALCLGEAGVSSSASKGTPAFDWSAVDTQPEQAKHILKAIRSWRGKEEKNGGKKLRVVYFYPKDRKPLKEHTKRWDGIMNDIQDFYRTEMKRLGYGKVELGLERENGLLKLHEVRGNANDDGSYTYGSGPLGSLPDSAPHLQARVGSENYFSRITSRAWSLPSWGGPLTGSLAPNGPSSPGHGRSRARPPPWALSSGLSGHFC